jgi:hypothetical protein
MADPHGSHIGSAIPVQGGLIRARAGERDEDPCQLNSSVEFP